jgi:hypothetical protein
VGEMGCSREKWADPKQRSQIEGTAGPFDCLFFFFLEVLSKFARRKGAEIRDTREIEEREGFHKTLSKPGLIKTNSFPKFENILVH